MQFHVFQAKISKFHSKQLLSQLVCNSTYLQLREWGLFLLAYLCSTEQNSCTLQHVPLNRYCKEGLRLLKKKKEDRKQRPLQGSSQGPAGRPSTVLTYPDPYIYHIAAIYIYSVQCTQILHFVYSQKVHCFSTIRRGLRKRLRRRRRVASAAAAASVAGRRRMLSCASTRTDSYYTVTAVVSKLRL